LYILPFILLINNLDHRASRLTISKAFLQNQQIQQKAFSFLILLVRRKNVNENQCGFRKGYSTVENTFVLHSFFELIKLKKKKLFAAFDAFEKKLLR
jgi:hypothetical protein